MDAGLHGRNTPMIRAASVIDETSIQELIDTMEGFFPLFQDLDATIQWDLVSNLIKTVTNKLILHHDEISAHCFALLSG